jgi:GNAT superfamily N-acetyltransferase
MCPTSALGAPALAVADGAQSRGLGTRLARKLLAYAATRRLARIYGDVRAGNRPMLTVARRAGFGLHEHPADAALVRVERALRIP